MDVGDNPQGASLPRTPKTSNMHDGSGDSNNNRLITTGVPPTNNNNWGSKMNGTKQLENKNYIQVPGGELRAVVLSAYDLEIREPPSFVSIEVCNQTSVTGPPIQRHKDRNSFKFGPSSRSSTVSVGSIRSSSSEPMGIVSNEVSIRAPLPQLYGATMQIKLVYASNPNQNLIADYPLKQLNIGEPMWLILNLEKTSATTDVASLSNTRSATGYPNNEVQFGNNNNVSPTLRVQITLTGPYRNEINALISLSQAWFRFIDKFESFFLSAYENDVLLVRSGTGLVQSVQRNFDIKYILIPAVPIVAVLVVASPILVGIAVVTLPILLPVLSVVLVGIFTAAFIAAIIYFSTPSGRDVVGNALFKPLATTLLSSKVGQKLVYDTGPRPSPVHVARVIMPGRDSMWGCLIVSLVIDFIGSLSYLIPVLGEVTDIAWAPIQTVLVMAMYETTSPNIQYISFIEEILPFTDIVPTATAGWLKQFGLPFALGRM